MICGPGNIFVTLAKKMVYGQVAIDGLEGPTETLIITDETADPALCAADLLGQAEHDLLATPVLITTCAELVAPIQEEVRRQLAALPRSDTAASSIDRRGAFVVVDRLEEAIELANEYAPEHLCLLISDPWSAVAKVRHTGGIFLGDYSPEVMGDYVAGPSHVMPTGAPRDSIPAWGLRSSSRGSQWWLWTGRWLAGLRAPPPSWPAPRTSMHTLGPWRSGWSAASRTEPRLEEPAESP